MKTTTTLPTPANDPAADEGFTGFAGPIICRAHGHVFAVQAQNHLDGEGCPVCEGTESFYSAKFGGEACAISVTTALALGLPPTTLENCQ